MPFHIMTNPAARLRRFSLIILFAFWGGVSVPVTAQDDDGGEENQPPGAPPSMVPPPPPKIKPPSLPPNMKPPPMVPGETTGPDPAFDGEGRREMAMLERFLSMSPEALAKIRRTLERIEKMTPEEKEKLLARIREFRRMGEERRRQFLQQFESLDRREAAVLMRYFFQLPPSEREAMVARIRGMNPEERRLFLRDLRMRMKESTEDDEEEYHPPAPPPAPPSTGGG